MAVREISPSAAWPNLPVNSLFPKLNGHDPAWVHAVCRGLKHSQHTLVSSDDQGTARGLLPLVYVKSLLFGKFLVSLPYLNTGGLWTDSQQSADELIEHACQVADRLNVRFLELRHERPTSHHRLPASRTDKVHMRLALPDSDTLLDKSFKSKLRSQVKKTHEQGFTIQWGRHPLLRDFYQIFAVNMRDLGTPVFSRALFAAILDAFPEHAEICIVSKSRMPIACGLLNHAGGITEVPSASSLRAYNSTGANMWMYRQMLARAIERGSHTFDFGRSSLDSGTFKFKEQWGAQPHPSHWQYYVRRGSAEDMRPDSGNKGRLIELWKKLPVWLTRWLGPHIVRGIP